MNRKGRTLFTITLSEDGMSYLYRAINALDLVLAEEGYELTAGGTAARDQVIETLDSGVMVVPA